MAQGTARVRARDTASRRTLRVSAAALSLAILFVFVALPRIRTTHAQPLPESQPIVDARGNLARFRAALALARSGGRLTRILYLGDSAVVGDELTGALRERLQRRYGDGGHGFLPAGRPWPWYTHADVRHQGSGWAYTSVARPASRTDRLFGIHFLRATATGPASALWGTATSGPVGRNVSRFELFHLAQPGGGKLRLRVDDGAPRTLGTTAESPRAAYQSIDLPDGPHTLSLEAAGDGPVDVFGATMERVSGVVVDAIGINGAHSIHFLQGDTALLHEHLRHRPPALLAVQLGTNMSNGLSATRHGDRMVALMRRLQAAAPDAACLLISPPDRARRRPDGTEGTPDYIPAVVAQTARAARETGCAFWSAYAAMGGEGSFVRWRAHELAGRDEAHLTRGGYARLGRMLDQALTGDRAE
jgi:lysophospholipase L1-like esterase